MPGRSAKNRQHLHQNESYHHGGDFKDMLCSLRAQLAETLVLLHTHQQEQRVSCKRVTGSKPASLLIKQPVTKLLHKSIATHLGLSQSSRRSPKVLRGRGNGIQCCIQLQPAGVQGACTRPSLETSQQQVHRDIPEAAGRDIDWIAQTTAARDTIAAIEAEYLHQVFQTRSAEAFSKRGWYSSGQLPSPPSNLGRQVCFKAETCPARSQIEDKFN